MRKVMITVAALALLGLAATPGFSKGNQGQAGKSNIAHLDLVDVSGGEAWGKVKYNLSGAELDFVLNAKNLVAGESYVVKSGGQVIGEGVADADGNLHVNNAVDGSAIAPTNKFNVRVAGTNALVLSTDAHGYVYIAP